MKNRHSLKNFQLCLLKYFLVCSLSLLIIQDVTSATNMECEIRSSCFPSSGCLHTKPMIVDPGSNITLNCSIVTGGLVQGITWEQAKQRVQKSTGSSDLVLQQSNSTNNGNYSCQCTAINFTRALRIDWVTSSPNDIIQDKPMDLECFFSGWPLPRAVSWYKDDKIITNGTEGMHQSLEKKGETVYSILHLPNGREEQEGFYNCSATNNIPGWSSSASFEIEMTYECPLPSSPTISSAEILASTFSNVSLTCWVDFDVGCPESLLWYLNDQPVPSKSSKKYKEDLKETESKCKREFILSIINVTENDEGTYSCHWSCEHETTTKAAIDLKVSAQPPTEIPKNRSTSTQSDTVVIQSSSNPGSRREWHLPIIILSAGSVAVLFMFVLRFVVMKKWKSSYNMPKDGLNETDFINRLFISFSSKDFGWVTDNLISILENHSIDYSIHSRDFELGRPIVQNMADNVYCSRQVLIVLSDNYLASNFCREELHMAVQRGVDAGDSSLILVMINKLKKRQLPAALRNKNLLDFDKHKKKQDWEQKILREISESKTFKADESV
ncbi:hypothetical protein OS493_006698 [Desmophyllum pertusum]|uniref:Uncharacterized protein n=1 Tax=Desmophyllum pertusum TaxID=174260 RepID=A0A9W9ZT75_9CNID|nr:hypothetical protein OS493_006698 [Desmophyllum pertusum]